MVLIKVEVVGKNEAHTPNSYTSKFTGKIVTYEIVYQLENSAHHIDTSGNVAKTPGSGCLTILQVINTLSQKTVWLYTPD